MSPDAPSDWPRESEPLATLPAAAPLPATASEARGQVVAVLQARADHCGTAVGERALADILLVVSELLTNALRHGGGVTRFEVGARAEEIRVTVGDRSTDLPRRRTVDQQRARAGGEGGYGWPLVHQLATGITITLERDGKLITVTLPLR
ncbi:ATP-binding protein [Streptomyces sp. NPDC002564]|uniref:ATP-binding protein n=1 Tax=Streptomyces sp. NPDC002564 TaxID=3364649 RepID=UPI00369F4302